MVSPGILKLALRHNMLQKTVYHYLNVLNQIIMIHNMIVINVPITVHVKNIHLMFYIQMIQALSLQNH